MVSKRISSYNGLGFLFHSDAGGKADDFLTMEVADMVGKDHSKLLRDIRKYVEQLGEAQIGPSDFFAESIYQNSQSWVASYLKAKRSFSLLIFGYPNVILNAVRGARF